VPYIPSYEFFVEVINHISQPHEINLSFFLLHIFYIFNFGVSRGWRCANSFRNPSYPHQHSSPSVCLCMFTSGHRTPEWFAGSISSPPVRL